VTLRLGAIMKIETSWPWITLSILAVVSLNPIGLEIIHTAFSSGEQLARTLGQFLVYCALGIAAGVGVIEFGVRKFLLMRQRRHARGVANG
jgi:hypothetical protein